MKLDKRIIKGKRPLTCFDIDEAEKYIGKMCYISDNYDFFCDMDLTQQKILKGVEDCEVPFHFDSDKQAEFCLPCDWVTKEKQYRPYTLNEFLDKYVVCANIRIRQKDRTCQYFGKLIGYQFPTDPNTGKQKGDNDATVCIGGYNFKLTELFTDYEQYDNMKDIWVPCGVEVEE